MLKAIAFAVLHFNVAFGVSYSLTDSIGISGAVALIEPVTDTVVSYFHGKVQNRYEIGKNGKRQGSAGPLHRCMNRG